MQPSDIATKSYIDMLHFRSSTIDGWYAPVHDPRYAEIEQIMGEVGVKFVQVVAYATEYATDPQTASCIVQNALGGVLGHKLLININARKWFTIQVDRIDMYSLPSVARLFDIHDPDFFVKLARYLRMHKVISLPKFGFVMLKLWWNK